METTAEAAQSAQTLQDEKRGRRRHSGRAIVIFTALVMHFHGVYGLLAIVNDYILPVVVAVTVAVGSIAILTAENTLGNILAFEMDVSDEVVRRGFCCGMFDYHLKTCLGFRCSARLCFNRRIYFVRLFYYNMNAFLIAAAWFGIDINRALVIERVAGPSLAGRVFMDVLFLVLSNIVLVSYHELMGQFGVVGDQAVVQYADEDSVETMEADVDSPISRANTPRADGAVLQFPSTLQTKLITTSSSTSPRPRGGSSASPSRPRAMTREVLSWKEDYKSRAHIVVAFIALTMFWTATWDLFCSIPSEVMVAGEGDDDDTDDDYYDVHVKGQTDEEFQLFFLGLAYSVVAIGYMIITGEMFSAIKRQDSKSEKIRLYFKEKIGCTLPYENMEWMIGKMRFFPVRLVVHNLKGGMSVIGWAGLSMMISSLERNIIFNIRYNLQRRIMTELFWIVLANVILIATNDFGLQYGGSGHLSRKHEVMSIDMGVLPEGRTALDIDTATPSTTPSNTFSPQKGFVGSDF